MTTKVQSDMVNIDGATVATVAAADKINFLDVTDSLVKEDTVQGILDLAGGFTLGTEQATTSGTAFTFGSIPAGTKMIIINFHGVSMSGTDKLLITLGDSGGLETSGYVSSSARVETSSNTSTSGFIVSINSASAVINGHMMLALEDSANFSWTSSHSLSRDSTTTVAGGGTKSLSAELTQVSITRDGSNTFDAGAINILYI